MILNKKFKSLTSLVAFLLFASIVRSYIKKDHVTFKNFENINVFCIILTPKGKHKTGLRLT